MTPEALASLHARAFPGPPRPWSADEFESLLIDATPTPAGERPTP